MDVWDLVAFPTVGAIIAVLLLLWGLYLRYLVVVPPNRALVIFGRSGHSTPRPNGASGSLRIVVGGAAFVAPRTHGVAYLPLGVLDVEVSLRGVGPHDGPRGDGFDLKVSAQAKIPSDPATLRVAAENLLGRSEEDLRALVRGALESHIPAVLARMRSEEIEHEWEHVAQEALVPVATDLLALGLLVRTLNVRDVARSAPGPRPDLPHAAVPSPASPELESTVRQTAALLHALELRVEGLEHEEPAPVPLTGPLPFLARAPTLASEGR